MKLIKVKNKSCKNIDILMRIYECQDQAYIQDPINSLSEYQFCSEIMIGDVCNYDLSFCYIPLQIERASLQFIAQQFAESIASMEHMDLRIGISNETAESKWNDSIIDITLGKRLIELNIKSGLEDYCPDLYKRNNIL